MRQFHRQRSRVALCGLLGGCAVVSACGCRLSGAAKPIPLTTSGRPPAAKPEPPRDRVLQVAIAPVISPQETLFAYKDLVAFIGEAVRRPARVIQRRSYAETNEVLRRGVCDLAFVCSLAYVRGQEEFGMEPLVIPQVAGKTTYQCYIIVPARSPARKLTDLRGKSFAFVDPLSNSGWLAPVAMVRKLGRTPERFFSKTIYTYSHDNSIRAVATALVDGAAVDSLVYHYLARRTDGVSGTRILVSSEPFGIPPVVVPPGLNETLKAELRTAFLTMHQSERGRRILAELLIDRFLPRSATDYTSIRTRLEAEERS